MLEVFASSLLVSVNFLFRNIAAFDSEAADHSHRPPRDQRRRALQRSVRRSVPGILIPRYRYFKNPKKSVLYWNDFMSFKKMLSLSSKMIWIEIHFLKYRLDFLVKIERYSA